LDELKKAILFGKNAFVAKGLSEILDEDKFQVDWFSRGVNSRSGNIIFGSTATLLANEFFQDRYDILVNFVILKDQSIEENIQFIDSLLKFAALKGISKLIHFSSVMVYPYESKMIDENSHIEDFSRTTKGHYAQIKIAVDDYILKESQKYDFEVSLVRPGYVFDQTHQPNFSKKIIGNIRILLGDSKSVLPTIEKTKLHLGLLQLFEGNKMPLVCHFFSNYGTNKLEFTLAKYPNTRIINVNRIIMWLMPKIIFNRFDFTRLLRSRFESLFIRTNFSSIKTMDILKVKF
jgi:hypothetical protein